MHQSAGAELASAAWADTTHAKPLPSTLQCQTEAGSVASPRQGAAQKGRGQAGRQEEVTRSANTPAALPPCSCLLPLPLSGWCAHCNALACTSLHSVKTLNQLSESEVATRLCAEKERIFLLKWVGPSDSLGGAVFKDRQGGKKRMIITQKGHKRLLRALSSTTGGHAAVCWLCRVIA